MVEEELKKVKDKFYGSDLSLEDKIHFWFSLQCECQDFEKYLEKIKKEELSND